MHAELEALDASVPGRCGVVDLIEMRAGRGHPRQCRGAREVHRSRIRSTMPRRRHGDVAQLARAPALQAGGRGFESHRLHQCPCGFPGRVGVARPHGSCPLRALDELVGSADRLTCPLTPSGAQRGRSVEPVCRRSWKRSPAQAGGFERRGATSRRRKLLRRIGPPSAAGNTSPLGPDSA